MASAEGFAAREEVTENGTTSTRITSYLIDAHNPLFENRRCHALACVGMRSTLGTQVDGTRAGSRGSNRSPDRSDTIRPPRGSRPPQSSDGTGLIPVEMGFCTIPTPFSGALCVVHRPVDHRDEPGGMNPVHERVRAYPIPELNTANGRAVGPPRFPAGFAPGHRFASARAMRTAGPSARSQKN
jgi:hypothetical protein